MTSTTPNNKAASFSSVPLWEDTAAVLQNGRLGLLCNHVAWHMETGEYLFETIHKRGVLKRVFTPEHGLFGELQDQLKLDGGALYKDLGFENCEFVSLYGSQESSLTADSKKLIDLDALVIDLQDVGIRYYTYLSTLRNLFITLKKENIPLPVWVVDRENPAGPWVEGSPLKPEYASFIGIEGLPHRHGLTIGELAGYFHSELEANFPLHIVSWQAGARGFPWTIAPSPNFPGFFTAAFYSGQCLWEGTNVSEGRGTTRPFEVFGAPWMENLMGYNKKAGYEGWNDPRHPLFDSGAALRWQHFIPTFSKYKGECCFGFQLILRDPKAGYHALLHSLRIIRFIETHCDEFYFRPGKYENGSEKAAIELFAGDPLIADYIYGKGPEEKDIQAFFKKSEEAWIEKTRQYRFYEEPLKHY
jgi:uncharacterized protein YbbC (DUF1343 family)